MAVTVTILHKAPIVAKIPELRYHRGASKGLLGVWQLFVGPGKAQRGRKALPVLEGLRSHRPGDAWATEAEPHGEEDMASQGPLH